MPDKPPDADYMLVVGGGKVGWNLARELIDKGHEVTLIEADRDRYLTVEQELEHRVLYGDASELWVLERAGIVTSRKSGRTRTYQLAPGALELASAWLAEFRNHWERALDQLDHFLITTNPTVSPPANDPTPRKERT